MRKFSIGMVNGILALAVLFMGLPCVVPGDLNRDMDVNLADAILGVRDLSDTADGPGPFNEKMKTAVTAVAVAAGLEMRISPDRRSGVFQTVDNYYVMPTQDALFLAGISILPVPVEKRFCSLHISPPLRPPRAA